ncbi:MAG: hypothetical protein JW784_04140 [Candidatus Cloacimonetes bacterium]|nr:hypothetical protein [Candidatus Cloacimonadota bacterium]
MMRFANMIILACLLSLAGLALEADDVTEAINEGMKYYQQGEYSQAIESLSYANQLIKQKKGGQLEAFLPQPLPGWEADDAVSSAAGEALFGGGVVVERNYYKDDASVHIQIVTDSPLLTSVMMMMSNPMFATSDGGKMEKIGGQKALVKYTESDRSGEVQVVVNNRYLVTVDGYSVSLDNLRNYTAAINFDGIMKLQ